MSLCFQPFKEVLHFGLHDLRFQPFKGPYLYCLPPLAVLLDAGADEAVVAVFFRACLRGGGERLRRAEAAGAAAGLFRPCWRGGEGGGC